MLLCFWSWKRILALVTFLLTLFLKIPAFFAIRHFNCFLFLSATKHAFSIGTLRSRLRLNTLLIQQHSLLSNRFLNLARIYVIESNATIHTRRSSFVLNRAQDDFIHHLPRPLHRSPGKATSYITWQGHFVYHVAKPLYR